MDGSAKHDKTQRTLASQPAAAAHVGSPAAGEDDMPQEPGAQPVASGDRAPRTRLERMLLAARQMQQV